MLIRAIPFVFVILWASGFVGARFGLQYAEPATLLSIRMAFMFFLRTDCSLHLLIKAKNYGDGLLQKSMDPLKGITD